jgi:plasmid stabilization system protein ParE
MRLVLHPKVYSDIDEIMGYYERVATPGLAEEFYTELRYFMTKAADKPESFSIRERLCDLGCDPRASMSARPLEVRV